MAIRALITEMTGSAVRTGVAGVRTRTDLVTGDYSATELSLCIRCQLWTFLAYKYIGYNIYGINKTSTAGDNI